VFPNESALFPLERALLLLLETSFCLLGSRDGAHNVSALFVNNDVRHDPPELM
jgi:hypothetical protein